jgi:hypothetical protein
MPKILVATTALGVVGAMGAVSAFGALGAFCVLRCLSRRRLIA